ncbi:hypothetical protein [Aquimarina longa]|uniref:hypothetical protein n=1 Tax=Aquimarina longa TaxID=1080221 RepID=UPI0007808E79|nr:hypothetical protein [Aquimarina longa]
MDILAKITEQEFTESGEIPLGFLFASVKNIGDTPITVNNVTLKSGEAKSYPFIGKPYNAISFETNDSTLQVLYVL